LKNLLYNTLFVGNVLLELKEVNSTNSYIQNLLSKQNLSEGTSILTYDQTGGRGQFGNSWQSESGKNIAVSILLKPNFLKADQQFYLNKAISLGVHDALKSIISSSPGIPDSALKIKWPNDIYFNDKKICGLLIENSLHGEQINNSIIGIGLNVNQENFKNLLNAGSLKNMTGNEMDLKQTVSALFHFIEKRYLQLRNFKWDDMNREYLQALYRYQEYHIYEATGEVFKGQILGVSERGELMIESEGKIRKFNFKEVKHL
jgi:BirA family biotin operon repressor/biotin-[acetyl-CoA-carboxylase] ligase